MLQNILASLAPPPLGAVEEHFFNLFTALNNINAPKYFGKPDTPPEKITKLKTQKGAPKNPGRGDSPPSSGHACI